MPPCFECMQEGNEDAKKEILEGDKEAEKTMEAVNKADKTYDPNNPEEEEIDDEGGESPAVSCLSTCM